MATNVTRRQLLITMTALARKTRKDFEACLASTGRTMDDFNRWGIGTQMAYAESNGARNALCVVLGDTMDNLGASEYEAKRLIEGSLDPKTYPLRRP